ncbi:MAG: hypothetical protein K2Y21_01650 [Phycisphaerales bacterium]|nr:hypothetical protein [Phycisphaerales bacterium]
MAASSLSTFVAASLSACLVMGMPVASAAFTPGDCIHVTIASGYGPGTKAAVILISGTPLTLTPLVTGNGIIGDGAYDSFRQSAVVIRVPVGPRLVSAINSAGAITDIPYSGPQDATLVAPTGDGRIYIQRSGKWSYIDHGGVTHDLLNAAGTGLFVQTKNYRRAYYDPSTKSIFCGDAIVAGATITKIPLSTDGTKLAAAPTDLVLSTPGLQSPTVVGISPGPSGKLFLKIDDNGGGLAPRMLLLDPATLTQTVYAQSNYFGVGGEIAGCYSPKLNVALVVDSLADQLRFFTIGASGAGTIVANTSGISSGGGSGENATMFAITPSTAVCLGDLNNDGFVDDADFSLFAAAYNILDCAYPAMPAGCPADLNKDGFVDDADFSMFAAAYDALLCP